MGNNKGCVPIFLFLYFPFSIFLYFKLVVRPEDYRWTSYRDYIDTSQKNSFVDRADTLSYFSKTKDKAAKAYKTFVEAGIGGQETPLKEIEAGVILGDKRFKAKIMRLLDRIRADEELPQARRLRENIPIDTIIRVCSIVYGRKEEDLLRKGRRGQERQIAIYLSKILSGKKNKEIGSYFGIKGPAISGVIKTIEERLDKENNLQKEMEHLKQKIINE